MGKKIVSRDELMAFKLSGLSKIAGIVKRTLGPGGLPILIQRVGQALDGSPLGPKITKDGVSVAEECSSSIEEEDIVIQAVKAICRKTVSVAGDGTTTAIVLGEAIVKQMEQILKDDPTLNPQLVKESVEIALKDVMEALKNMATKVEDMSMIKEVATISANGDASIGEIIGKAFQAVGAEGVITVDEGSTSQITLDVVDGYQFNRGAEARQSFFNTKNQTSFEAENCAVIIYDGKIFNYTDLIPVIKVLRDVDDNDVPRKPMPPLLILANEFSNEVLQFLLIQKTDMGMQVCPVIGPNATHVRTGYYDDIAIYSGGTRLGNGARNLGALEADDIGLVKRVIVDKYKTTLYEGQGDEDAVLERVGQLKALKSQSESPYDTQVCNDRIAAITNGVAKIGVGGSTELEIKEKYDRIEDALNAARAAIEEGVVPGGGTALLRIARSLPSTSVGHYILKEALCFPFMQILENVGISKMSELSEIAKLVCENSENVYDARNKQVKNSFEVGIIDPVKVTRTALENAVSVASLLSTAGGAIIYTKDDK